MERDVPPKENFRHAGWIIVHPQPQQTLKLNTLVAHVGPQRMVRYVLGVIVMMLLIV